MKYLRSFENQAAYNAAKSGDNFYTPCVSLIEDTMNCNFDPYVPPTPPTPSIPDDEIWYTSYDGQVISPYNTSALPTIVSNTYENGKGVIKFESDVTSIGEWAFYDCTYLTSVTIPNSVTSIGESAFSYCGFTSIIIPDSVISIGNSAFYSTELTSIIIPDSVISIGDNAFYECPSLVSIVLGNSVQTIGDSAFEHISWQDPINITITIPASVTSIGRYALNTGYTGGQNIVTFESTNPISLVEDDEIIYIFGQDGYSTTPTIYVPNSALNAYKTHDAGWEVLAPYVVGYDPV